MTPTQKTTRYVLMKICNDDTVFLRLTSRGEEWAWSEILDSAVCTWSFIEDLDSWVARDIRRLLGPEGRSLYAVAVEFPCEGNGEITLYLPTLMADVLAECLPLILHAPTCTRADCACSYSKRRATTLRRKRQE